MCAAVPREGASISLCPCILGMLLGALLSLQMMDLN